MRATKPAWMMTAGNAIMDCIAEGNELDTYPSPHDFANIIDSYRPPEEKAAPETAAERDRLLDILKRLRVWARTLPDCEPMADILKDVRAALAKHESTDG